MHKSLYAISIAGLFAISLQGGPAYADDEKLISSAICQAMTPTGAAHLRHNGSSLEAKDVPVTVICPVIRDSVTGRLKWVEVRHLRPSGAAGQQVAGKVYSCDAAHGGCSETSEAHTDNSNEFTSVFVDASNLPSGRDRYFYYHSVLPVNWKIVSFGYLEE